MKYDWSAETDRHVSERLRLIGLATESLIQERLAAGELEHIDIEVVYVPVIMPPYSAKNYPARTKVSERGRLLDCAPQLDYEKFSNLRPEVAAEEYVSGIIRCLPKLSELHLSPSELKEVRDFFLRVSGDLQGQLHGVP